MERRRGISCFCQLLNLFPTCCPHSDTPTDTPGMGPWSQGALHCARPAISLGSSPICRTPLTVLFRPRTSGAACRRAPRFRSRVRGQQEQEGGPQNFELLVGDGVLLLTFCAYKQIAALVISPAFPGWLAPLEFNPIRFAEFASFWLTLTGTWVAVGLLTTAYSANAAADLPTALSRTCRTWIAAMPVAAAQLVLLTAAEDGALVGTDGWAAQLPLAASGPGEPFVTAAGVLGLMAVWRSFYAVYLDTSKFLSIDGARLDREVDARHFLDALAAAAAIATGSCLVLHTLSTALVDR